MILRLQFTEKSKFIPLFGLALFGGSLGASAGLSGLRCKSIIEGELSRNNFTMHASGGAASPYRSYYCRDGQRARGWKENTT